MFCFSSGTLHVVFQSNGRTINTVKKVIYV